MSNSSDPEDENGFERRPVSNNPFLDLNRPSQERENIDSIELGNYDLAPRENRRLLRQGISGDEPYVMPSRQPRPSGQFPILRRQRSNRSLNPSERQQLEPEMGIGNLQQRQPDEPNQNAETNRNVSRFLEYIGEYFNNEIVPHHFRTTVALSALTILIGIILLLMELNIIRYIEMIATELTFILFICLYMSIFDFFIKMFGTTERLFVILNFTYGFILFVVTFYLFVGEFFKLAKFYLLG